MEEKQITEIESIQIIQQMIDRAKNSIVDKGTWPIYWGALITFCSLFVFVEVKLQHFISFDIFLLTIPAMVIQLIVIFYQKNKSKNKPKPIGLSQKAIAYTWIAFAVSMLLVSFTPEGNNATVYFVLYGIPTFATGGIINFKPMTIGGIVCWLCALIVIVFKIDSSIKLLLVSVCSISAWLIPGIILRSRYLRLRKIVNV
ncbi:MAG: hypothetical protein DI598_09395 [Pseudopedobacter saltans]|uniref:Uncharacterized protein n=1 Tax=Pseudopedobacter saltans TaxID=151895 RepID=A0A2W5F202_9SPHI|nr:MAG: hypothetical protein DI598_09395 [Pseudopedobacter saltans]